MTLHHVVAHCVAGDRPLPFISDIVTRLDRFDPICLARDRIHRPTWGSTPIVQSQDRPGWTGPDFLDVHEWFDDVPEVFDRAIRRYSPVLLHAHHGMFALEFVRLSAVHRLPLVTSFYGYDASGFGASSPANRRRLRHLFDASDVVTAMSEDMRRDLAGQGCPQSKIRILQPCVDTARFTPTPPPGGEGVTVVCVSDFSAKKGVRTLVEAFGRLLEEFGSSRLHLVGEPTTSSRSAHRAVRRMVDEFGLAHAVRFVGWVEYGEIASVYRGADIVALASETGHDGSKEGIPAVLLEAMASGRPVLSTYHAGIPDAVLDGHTGFLVPEADAPALATAMTRLVRSRELRVQMGCAGRQRVEAEFDCGRRAESMSEFYASVITGSTHQRRSDP